VQRVSASLFAQLRTFDAGPYDFSLRNAESAIEPSLKGGTRGARRRTHGAPAGDGSLLPQKGVENHMSSTKSMPTKATTLARVQALITGLQKHFPNGSFTILGIAYTTATLVQLLQGLLDAINVVNVAEANAKDAVAALTGAKTKVGPVLVALRRILVAMFSGQTPTLADFGLTPPKARAPKTVEQKAAAKAKAAATRKARGTTSKKQKLAVHGDVTGVTITPVTSAAPQAATESPAQTAPNASPAQPATK